MLPNKKPLARKRTASRKAKAERRGWREAKGKIPPKDPAYLAFIASQPCLVTGERPVTVHHVRRYGDARDDRRTVPLIASLHMLTHEKPGRPCVERGKRVFQKHWGVDLETAIVLYNELYERERKDGLVHG